MNPRARISCDQPCGRRVRALPTAHFYRSVRPSSRRRFRSTRSSLPRRCRIPPLRASQRTACRRSPQTTTRIRFFICLRRRTRPCVWLRRSRRCPTWRGWRVSGSVVSLGDQVVHGTACRPKYMHRLKAHASAESLVVPGLEVALKGEPLAREPPNWRNNSLLAQ